MLCLQRIPAPLLRSVRCSVSSRGTAICCLEPASWRHARTPVTEQFARPRRSLTSCSWPLVVKATDSRVECWSSIFQQVKPTPGHAGPVYRGGHERSAARWQTLGLLPQARGLCTGASKETQQTGPVPEQKEAGTVPGHGLFKFKELVSSQLKDNSQVGCLPVREMTSRNIPLCMFVP